MEFIERQIDKLTKDIQTWEAILEKELATLQIYSALLNGHVIPGVNVSEEFLQGELRRVELSAPRSEAHVMGMRRELNNLQTLLEIAA